MNKIASKLRSFAKGRETAYRVHQKLTTDKSKAISNILSKCDYFSQAKTNGWIRSIQQDLLLILPREDSSFKKKRVEILNILNQY